MKDQEFTLALGKRYLQLLKPEALELFRNIGWYPGLTFTEFEKEWDRLHPGVSAFNDQSS